MEIHLVSDLAGFEALEQDWNDLFERAGRSHHLFQSFNWLWHWYQTFLLAEPEHASPKLSIIVGRSDGRTVVIWPLVTTFNMGVKQACWMGAPVSQYNDGLAEDSPDQKARLRDCWKYICTQLEVDIIRIPKIREDSLLFGLLSDLNLQPAARMEAPFADLSKVDSYEEFATRFSAKKRANIRRRWRRLGETGAVSHGVFHISRRCPFGVERHL